MALQNELLDVKSKLSISESERQNLKIQQSQLSHKNLTLQAEINGLEISLERSASDLEKSQTLPNMTAKSKPQTAKRNQKAEEANEAAEKLASNAAENEMQAHEIVELKIALARTKSDLNQVKQERHQLMQVIIGCSSSFACSGRVGCGMG